MAFWRGQDGSATFATIAISQITDWSINSTMPTVDQTVKGDSHRKIRGGIPATTCSITGMLDYVTGQQDLIDFLAASVPIQVSGALVLTVNTGKTATLQAVCTGYSVSSPSGDGDCSVSFSFESNGAVAWAWA